MTRKLLTVLLLASVAVLLAGFAMAEGKDAEGYSYIGLKKCTMCHKSAKIGDQLGVWQEGPHAGAFADLSSEAGLAKAKELGVEDPATNDACLKCHTTGHGAAGNEALLAENGVSCEACHGPGSGYKSKKTMAGIAAGEIDGATVGLIEPIKEVCLSCHVADNPGHKGEFDYEAAVKKIAHPIPDTAAVDD